MIDYKVKVNVPALNVRADASMESEIVKVANEGDAFTIVEVNNGWGKLDDKSGWVMLEFCERTTADKKEESEVAEDED